MDIHPLFKKNNKNTYKNKNDIRKALVSNFMHFRTLHITQETERQHKIIII